MLSSATAGKSTPLSNQPPGRLTSYFQWHESTGRLGTAYETQRVRSAVDTTSVFRQAFFENDCFCLKKQRARAAFAADESLGRRDCEGDCRPWCIAICSSDAAIHDSVAFLCNRRHLNQPLNSLLALWKRKCIGGFCNSAAVRTGLGLRVTELTARLDVDDS